MEEVLNHQLHKKPADISVAVQGFGNVGTYFALTSFNAGSRVVAITDAFGGVYNPDGLNVPDLMRYATNHPKKSVLDYPKADAFDNKNLFSLDVDVLAPCAMQGQLTQDNADNVHAKLVVEGANGPTTPIADQILNEKGVIVAPDILVNAGGVTVSYFEWVQGLYSFFWKEQEVNNRLNDILTNSYQEVLNTSNRYEIKDLRTAAMALSVKRVAKAIELRGIFP